MNPAPKPLGVLEGLRPGELPIDALIARGQPMLLKGIASDWALVAAAKQGPMPAMDYLRGCYNGRPIQYSWGAPEIHGRPFYDSAFTALNFEVRRGTLDTVLTEIAAHLQDPLPPTWYVASLPIDACLPGFRADNDLNLAAQQIHAPPSIWIGNRVVASCHYDAPNNIACCAVGRRRFTVFPPDQIGNLYPGPLELTPGGQAISVVDFLSPDFARYPRFRDALSCAQFGELDPGDAIFIPSMWWHHVEALSPFNVLVNYWWGSMPAYIPTPMHALFHAIWTIRDRPEQEKQAWREVFEYYVFGDNQRAGAHLPESARNMLGPIDETRARLLRAMLIDKLNR